MEASEEFQEVIKAHLDGRAQTDELFAKTYAKEGKSIKECCDYIIIEVKQSGKNALTDDEVYGMAVHYYDEDNIKVGNAPEVKVVMSRQAAGDKQQAAKTAASGKDKPKAEKESGVIRQTLFEF
jgi:hypothetical protein